MKYTLKILLVTIVSVALYACSTKKDTVINRNYHVLTTKYNILFNGEEAFEEGLQGIADGFKDDWFEQLPIEPITFDDRKIVAPSFKNSGPGAGFGNSQTATDAQKPATPFDRAEEKAVKAIQKHAMNIDGLERNRQIDDAYLLLGKARYYTQRFVPAVEAFNYVIANYPNASLIAETKIWRAKANIRMDNEQFAIETLKLLLEVRDSLESNLPDKIKEQGHTALAMAYQKTDSLQKVKKHLQLAIRTQKNKDQTARNMFILGQMYAKENKKDSAALVFQKLISFKKAPYKYKIHANIALASTIPNNDSLSETYVASLQKLIKKRENRPYLNKLYYQLANLYEKQDSISLAIATYNKSLRAKNTEEKQQVLTFEKLGNIYFKNSDYMLASSYYDSVVKTSTDSLNLRVRKVKRKHKNLASLIKYEKLVAKNDSILKIAAMPKEAQKEYFEDFIATLKKKDAEAAQLRLNQIAFAGNTNSLQSINKGKWYFYNIKSLGFGKTEFQKIWGKRQLADDWRWSFQAKLSKTTKDSAIVAQKNERYNLKSYLASIPTSVKKIDTLIQDRNKGLFELGLIYKTQFNNKKLAIDRLESVLKFASSKELILPANWHLYEIYKELNNKEKAAIYKNVILTEYPTTVFAQIIKNPEKKITDAKEETATEKLYKDIYYLYKKENYSEVIDRVINILPFVKNSKLVPKLQLIKAYAIGKSDTKENYKKSLEFVAVNYPTTAQGKQALIILKKLDN